MYTGRMGTAMIPKVMSNMLCCAQVVAMGEILMIGKRIYFLEFEQVEIGLNFKFPCKSCLAIL